MAAHKFPLRQRMAALFSLQRLRHLLLQQQQQQVMHACNRLEVINIANMWITCASQSVRALTLLFVDPGSQHVADHLQFRPCESQGADERIHILL